MYLDFISQNWHLFLLLVLITLMLIMGPMRAKALGIESISPLRVPQLVNHDDGVIVDICETKEYSKGHIPDSISIPLSGLKNNLQQLDKYKDKPIILSCRSGGRARSAAVILGRNKFSQIYVLAGGLMAWKKENMPITSK